MKSEVSTPLEKGLKSALSETLNYFLTLSSNSHYTLKIHNSVAGSTLLSAWLVKPEASTPLERKALP